ncbi:uncharacterized protein RCO7_14270 [Rhynchosporium graminicola]|uniref:Uncharacterized protein n=1 Tax=Rhynchosporium graminicola TaxID=2792576 RepID=A0A1E1K9I3_9HELO|nr:uncharacterized protein RCO7_14270 [Rhynchosporium commune]
MDLGIMVLPWSISVYGVLNEIPKPPFVGSPSPEKKRYQNLWTARQVSSRDSI